MPVLTIIAGPNGAGKSTHSKELLSNLRIDAFDFDKEFYTTWSQFGFDPYVAQGAFDHTKKLYLDRRTAAVQQKQNFAFETNYHTKDIFPVINLFRSNKYDIELVFICLESPDEAIERVKDRVAKGGHTVDKTTILERFRNGLGLLDESFRQFDLVSIYLSKQNDINAMLILEPPLNNCASFAPFPPSLTAVLSQIDHFTSRCRPIDFT